MFHRFLLLFKFETLGPTQVQYVSAKYVSTTNNLSVGPIGSIVMRVGQMDGSSITRGRGRKR
jgi:hypothetical protein